MRKLYTTILAACLMLTAQAQNLNFDWVKQVGGSSNDLGQDITIDADGSILTTGYFWETVDFDPGIDVHNLTAVGGGDIFVQKLDANGDFLWVTTTGQAGIDSGTSIVTDANNNVYVTGYLDEVLEFETEPDIFVQKIDSDGNILWTREIGAGWDDFGTSIVVDADGNVYITGQFGGTVDFDPGAGTQNLTAQENSHDMFVQKLDTDGSFLWVKQMGGSGDDAGRSMTIDANGHIYITGIFEGTTDFDPGPDIQNLVSEGGRDIFVQKLDANGNFLWVKQMGGGDSFDFGESITLDANGHIYTTGQFGETVDFDPGSGVQNLTAAGVRDVFIQKLDTNGDFLWVKQMGETGLDQGQHIITDTNNGIYTIGVFEETVDFDPGGGVQNLTSEGERDIFIQKLDANGNLLWVKQMGGTGIDIGNSIAIDANNHIYATGRFQETVDFDPGAGVQNLTSTGSWDIFIQKLGDGTVNLNDLTEKLPFTLYPNPTHGQFSLSFEEILPDIEVAIKDIQGRLIHTSRHQQADKIDLELNKPSGLYYIELKTPEGRTTTSVIKK